MKNLKISTKLYMTLILYSTVFIVVGFLWNKSLQENNVLVESLVSDQITHMTQIKEINDAFNQGIVFSLESYLDSTIYREETMNSIISSIDIVDEQWKKYLATDSLFTEKELIILENGIRTAILNSSKEVKNLARELQYSPDSLVFGIVDMKYHEVILPLSRTINIGLSDLSESQVENAKEIRGEINTKYEKTKRFILIIVIIMLVGPGIMAIVMIIGIGSSIRKISTAFNQMAHGNLKIKFDSYGKDELGALMKKLEETANKLQEIIASVRIAAINMTHASNELSSVSQDIAQGASEQASTSEEIASSVEEMAGNIQQNNENAEATNKISSESSVHVQTVFESAKTSLERIVEIAEKVSIIGDIAFQTNILSLNAAVEAARAGEHGRGFGVVATEVGKLAERSKNAANEINDLSKLTVQVTEKSKGLLELLIPDIQKTSELVGQISVASQEQNQGANQVNIAIQQLSMVTQQNAASSEEMATSAAEMSAQAKQLMQTMSFFSSEEDQNNEFGTPISLPYSQSNRRSNIQGGIIIDLDDNDSLDNDFVKF